jgi:hypothetical protein
MRFALGAISLALMRGSFLGKVGPVTPNSTAALTSPSAGCQQVGTAEADRIFLF